MIHVSNTRIRMKQWNGLNNLNNIIIKTKELSAFSYGKILTNIDLTSSTT